MWGIKSMQVYSWKCVECTRRLARFIEFNFSDQYAICLNSRKMEFKGSVAQTFVCRGRREERWFEGGLAELRFNQPLLNLIHPILLCVVPSEFVQLVGGRSWTLDSAPPYLFLYLFYSSKQKWKQTRTPPVSNTGESTLYLMKKIRSAWSTKFYFYIFFIF